MNDLTENEIWKDIPGWEGYQASNLGRIRSFYLYGSKLRRMLNKPVILKGWIDKHGYRLVSLCKINTKKTPYVSNIIALTFLGPKPSLDLFVTHLDGNNKNNKISNLAYRTHTENMHDKIKHGTLPLGEKHHNSKLKANQVKKIFLSKVEGYILSKKFDISESQISTIRKGKSWKHLTINYK